MLLLHLVPVPRLFAGTALQRCRHSKHAAAQVLALEAALESQRLDTDDRIAQASKAASMAAAARAAAAPPATPPPGDGRGDGAAAASPLDRVAGALKGALGGLPTGGTSPARGGVVGAYGTPPRGGAGGATPGQYETDMDRRMAEAQRKATALAAQQRNEHQDTLVVVIAQPLGFDRGRPLAAMLIFRCCIQWKVFEVDRTNLFDRIMGAIGDRVELPKEGGDSPHNGALCYWLTNTVTLLLMLQKNLKPAATSGGRRGVGAPGGTPGVAAALPPSAPQFAARRCPVLEQSGLIMRLVLCCCTTASPASSPRCSRSRADLTHGHMPQITQSCCNQWQRDACRAEHRRPDVAADAQLDGVLHRQPHERREQR